MGLVVEPTATRTALRTCVSTRCLTELSMVAEKNMRLAIGGYGGHDPFDGGQETHVQHAVGFIQNQYADAAEIDEFPAEEIVQPPRSGDQHMRALADGLQLRSLVEPADDDGGANAGARRHFGEGLIDLDGELARRDEDDGPDAGLGWLLGDQMDHGQDKSERLAGAGLRCSDNVAPCQGWPDGLGLNGRWFCKAVLCQIAL